MAYIGQVSIRDVSHMEHAIKYISKEEKALSLKVFKNALEKTLTHLNTVNINHGERATYINCGSFNTYKEFELLRQVYHQDKGVIAHHYFQSFQKDDDITPEHAHEIGVQLVKKMFPDFQVMVTTHTDKEHLHNHIIVNSCNLNTGQKWHSNKQSLNQIRNESDKLCKANGLGVINHKSKYKPIDDTTYQLGVKGKSWKVQLVHDLDDAVTKCKSKEEFIIFFKEKGYYIRYKDVHITFTKIGQKKGIRADTLARQFGDKYKKDNLEKLMGYYEVSSEEIIKQFSFKKEKNNLNVSYGKSNWEYYEQSVFRKRKYYCSSVNKIYRNKKTDYIIRQINSFAYSKSLIEAILKFFIFLTSRSNTSKRKKYKQYKKKSVTKNNLNFYTVGNINYNKLINVAGDNFTIRTSLVNLLKLADQPIFYSAKVNRDIGIVDITIKAKDKLFLAKLLEIENLQTTLESQNESLSNKVMYDNLKLSAELSGEKLQYLVVNKEQLDILKANFLPVAYFENNTSYNIAFEKRSKKVIQKLLYSNESKTETEVQKNMRIYNELKSKAAQMSEKLCFRKISKYDLDMIKDNKIKIAYFKTDSDQYYNIAFAKVDESKICSLIYHQDDSKKIK